MKTVEFVIYSYFCVLRKAQINSTEFVLETVDSRHDNNLTLQSDGLKSIQLSFCVIYYI